MWNAQLTDRQLDSLRNGLLYAVLLSYAFFIFPGFVEGLYREELSLYLPRTIYLAVVGFVALLLVGRKALRAGWFAWLLLGYLGLVVASSLINFDPDGWTYVLLGNSSRSDGLLYQLGLVGFGLLLYLAVVRSPRVLREVIAVMMVVAVVQALLLILQGMGQDIVGPVLWGVAAIGNPTGTIGNTGMAAGLLLPFLVAATVLAARLRGAGGWLLLAAAVIMALGISFTGNRSSLLAGSVALVVALGLERRPRTFLAAAVTAGVLWFGADVLPHPKAYQPVHQASVSLSSRLEIWRIALEALPTIRGQPLIGGGADALELAQWRGAVPPERLADFYALRFGWDEAFGWPDEARLVGVETRPPPNGPLRGTLFLYQLETADGPRFLNHAVVLDKAHNLFLDKTLEFGVLAGLIWLLLFLWPIYQGLRSQDGLRRALALGLLAIFIYYQAWFPVVPTEPYHLALIGLAWASLRLPVGLLSSTAAPAAVAGEDEAPLRLPAQGAGVAHD